MKQQNVTTLQQNTEHSLDTIDGTMHPVYSEGFINQVDRKEVGCNTPSSLKETDAKCVQSWLWYSESMQVSD